MTVTILVAPAGAGKTEYVLNLARPAAAGLQATPHVVVPSNVVEWTTGEDRGPDLA